MLACVRDKKIVGAFHVVVEPGVDFYSAFRASEFHPLEVLQIEADCSRVNQFSNHSQADSLPSGVYHLKVLSSLDGSLASCQRSI